MYRLLISYFHFKEEQMDLARTMVFFCVWTETRVSIISKTFPIRKNLDFMISLCAILKQFLYNIFSYMQMTSFRLDSYMVSLYITIFFKTTRSLPVFGAVDNHISNILRINCVAYQYCVWGLY